MSPTHLRFLQISALKGLVLLASSAAGFAACELTDTPQISLSVTAAMVTGTDRTLRVQVFENGCVAIHQPTFYRAAGDYRLSLAASELAALKQSISPARVQQIDRNERALASRARASGARLERFEGVDADIYLLAVGAGGIIA